MSIRCCCCRSCSSCSLRPSSWFRVRTQFHRPYMAWCPLGKEGSIHPRSLQTLCIRARSKSQDHKWWLHQRTGRWCSHLSSMSGLGRTRIHGTYRMVFRGMWCSTHPQIPEAPHMLASGSPRPHSLSRPFYRCISHMIPHPLSARSDRRVSSLRRHRKISGPLGISGSILLPVGWAQCILPVGKP